MSIMLGTIMGLPLGIISALKRNSGTDLVSRLFSIIFLGVPNFWLALLVLLAGQRIFNWSPPLGRNLLWEEPLENLAQLIFPALIIGSSLMAGVARISRSSMLEVLNEDYVRTARAKGLAERVVVTRHALRNALIPVVTVISLSLGALLGGTVIVELVFTIPGLGQLDHFSGLPSGSGAGIRPGGFFHLNKPGGGPAVCMAGPAHKYWGTGVRRA